MNRIKRKKILKKVIVIIFSLTIIFFIVDYNCVKNQKEPIFCRINFSGYNDGGTEEYLGLGYKVILFHRWENYGIIDGINLMTVRYYYICPWWTTYQTAWNKIKNEAIMYNFKQAIMKNE